MSLSIRSAAVAAAAFAAIAMTSPARADTQAGRLDCRGGPATSFIVGSITTLDCTFVGRGRPQRFAATIRRAGVDLAITNQTMLTWLVFAPVAPINSGALAGWYGGVTAGATVGVGGNINVLVGGVNNAFTLQPISAQGQVGLAVAATVTGLELQPAGPARRMRRSRR